MPDKLLHTKKIPLWISNPPFNIGNLDNIAGTGGNSTLYKTASRFSLTQLPQDGIISFVTLKGIMPFLLERIQKLPGSVNFRYVNLMDDIDVWSYNTCYWICDKHQSLTLNTTPIIDGGIATKLISYYPADCFDLEYISSADNGLSKHFDPLHPNTVIRRLPGKNNNNPIYDKTNKVISAGPKFAFSVLESRKSYYVTDEPIYGGTICYIRTTTLDEANKLKLFVKNNPIYAIVVKALKERGHAFALRRFKKFDLNQIVTGKEIPQEWKLSKGEITNLLSGNYPLRTLQTPSYPNLDNKIIDYVRFGYQNKSQEKTIERIKSRGEFFTDSLVVNDIYETLIAIYSKEKILEQDAIDPFCGDGQFLSELLLKKLNHGIDIKTTLNQIHGVDIEPDNVETCRQRLSFGDSELYKITEQNIICSDTFKHDFFFNYSQQFSLIK